MALYSAPADSDDFSQAQNPTQIAQGWHETMLGWITAALDRSGGAFYDALESGGTVVPITWDAFPLVLTTWFASEADPDAARLGSAETLAPWKPGGRSPRAVRNGKLAEEVPLFRRQQDEYCEWFTHRDAQGTVTRVDFTCEGPEYWEHLATQDAGLCTRLYQEHVSPEVQPQDLLWSHDVAILNNGQWRYYARAGDYNGLNKWNTTHGAMHLTHPANTLGAEINLAADATVLRRAADGKRLDEAIPLICCAGYGGPTRSSDPSIGLGVNRAVAGGKKVALANPIGLYIAQLASEAFTDLDGNPVDCWTPTRGAAEKKMVLRATFTPPANQPVLVAGSALTYGGQIADHIQMVLYGAVTDRGGAVPDLQACQAKCCTHPTKPGFRVIVGLTDDCTRVPWEEYAPVASDAAGKPAVAAAGIDDVDDALIGIAVTEDLPRLPSTR